MISKPDPLDWANAELGRFALTVADTFTYEEQLYALIGYCDQGNLYTRSARSIKLIT